LPQYHRRRLGSVELLQASGGGGKRHIAFAGGIEWPRSFDEGVWVADQPSGDGSG
jgi:hypothetical protein